MTQETFADWDITDSNNTTITGSGAAIDIDEGWAAANVNNAMRALMAACVKSWGGMPSGGARPSTVQSGQVWKDTTTAATPIVKWYDGTDDITLFTVNTTTNTVTFNGTVSGAMADVADDTTPQLGGDLDVNSNSIISASNGDITIEPNGTGDILLNAAIVTVEDDIVHAGDLNNLISFGTDTQSYETGGTARLSISDSGVLFGASNDIDANTNKIVNVTDPTSAQDAATKAYVDANASSITPGTVTATTSGTAHPYTSLASGLNRISVILDQTSLNATDDLLVQLSVSSTFVTTGYTSRAGDSADTTTSTAGFVLTAAMVAANAASGVFTLVRITGNTWVISGGCDITAGEQQTAAGRIALAGTLDGVRLTSVAASTFDGGQFNIFTE